MTSIYQIINEIESTSGKNEKKAILERTKGSENESLLKSVLYHTYDPSLNYYIKAIPKTSFAHGTLSLSDFIDYFLPRIYNREITGNAAKSELKSNLELLSFEDQEVAKLIINRNLKCGIQAKTVNAVWKDLIYMHPYMRCESFSVKNMKSINLPCYSQVKMDGLYVDIMVKDDHVEYRSRAGNILPFNTIERDNLLLNGGAKGYSLQGEALALDEAGNILPREISNGYLNSNDVDATKVVFYVWDAVPLVDHSKHVYKVCYKDRFDKVNTIVNGLIDTPWLNIVNTVVCHNIDEIIEHFKAMREEGEEGTVVKDFNGLWKSHTSKHQIKVKIEFSVDLLLVGYKNGKNKYDGMVGALVCQSSDGIINVSVGSGLTDEQRSSMMTNIDSWIDNGLVITVKANDITKTDGRLSLFLPRFVELRFDKAGEADSYERIKEQLESSLDVLKAIQ